MTSYELLELHRDIITDLSEIGKYISDIKKIAHAISESSDILMQPLLKKGLDSNTQSVINQERDKILKSFNDFVNSFDMLKNHEILIRIKQNNEQKKELDRFRDLREEFNQLDEIVLQIEMTTSKIYEYVKTKNAGILVEVLNNISKTANLYDKFEGSYEHLEKFIKRLELSYKNENYENYKEFQFHFYNSNLKYKDFLNNLTSIGIIYNELRLVFNVEDFELQIIKIESGSLLGKILGNNNIIESLSYLLKKCIDLIFNKFTFEGKLLRKKELMDFIERSAEFPKKCEELGLKLVENDKKIAQENISKAYAVISGEILKMATQSAKIGIDDEVFSIQHKLTEKYLEEGKKLKLAENTTANI